MPKYGFNDESGEYEWIEKDGFSIDQSSYVYHWDDSEYRREDAEQQAALWAEEEDSW